MAIILNHGNHGDEEAERGRVSRTVWPTIWSRCRATPTACCCSTTQMMACRDMEEASPRGADDEQVMQ